MRKKIIFTAGGTGGHILPAINLMKHFLEKDYKVLLVTDKRGNNFIKNNLKFKSYILKTGTPTNKNIIKKILSLFIIFYSIVKSFIILKKEKPDLIIGFGGYVSFPISIASKFFKLPLIIYENNMVMGRANKYLSKFSNKILLSTNLTKNIPKNVKEKVRQVGPILGKDFINYSKDGDDKDKLFFTVLILGGSQGTEIFGKVVPPVIKKIKEEGYDISVNQQCTMNQKITISEFYNKNKIKNYIFNFDENILQIMASSNLAITRSGASTTAELMHTITPFISVPLQNSIDNHQFLNAKYYEEKGCGWILEENNLNIETLFYAIMKVLKNKNELENMKKNMKKYLKKDVYNNIEKNIREFI
jgi:UDP-N-acetylglucosamine--N-acetylmuramyl-(pentapeptide) pyrophosphoryl-undecaprenol N-acetylglucosamine transferase